MSFVKNALKPGDRLHGFTVTRVSDVLDGRACAVEAEHDQSGARLLHLYADDAENLFAIAFSTPEIALFTATGTRGSPKSAAIRRRSVSGKIDSG